MIDIKPGEHVCIVTTAQTEQTNPVSITHRQVMLVLVVERDTGMILDCDTNMVCGLTKRFLYATFVGRNLVTESEEIKASLTENYFGASVRALISMTRSAKLKFADVAKKNK